MNMHINYYLGQRELDTEKASPSGRLFDCFNKANRYRSRCHARAASGNESVFSADMRRRKHTFRSANVRASASALQQTGPSGRTPFRPRALFGANPDLRQIITAAAPGAAAGAAAGPPRFADAAQGEDDAGRQRGQDDEIGKVHAHTPSAMNTARSSSVTTQATAHCHATTPTAHLRPSSRRMDAMAATQGV